MSLRTNDEIAALMRPRPVPVDDSRWLACGRCGVRVEDAVVVESKDLTTTTPAGNRLAERLLDLGRCAQCEAHAEHVTAILRAHPALLRVRGDAGARADVTHVLTALAALGQPLPSADVPDADLALLVHHLREIGASAAYRRTVTQRSANPFPFAHLSADRTQALRAALGGVLHEQVARSRPPLALPPPKSSARPGCAQCGVATIFVPATTVARLGRINATLGVWHPVNVAVTSLGRRSPDSLKAHVCPACWEQIEQAGAVGPTSLFASLIEHLRESGAVQVADALAQAERDGTAAGIVGWGALPRGTPVNERRWSHVSLDGLSD